MLKVSERMRRVAGKNTAPEMIVRKLCHHCGFRFRLHVSGLPGKPDLVFPKLKKIIFINGCFWHRHGGTCKKTTMPKVNSVFWKNKFDATVKRDARNLDLLKQNDWQVLIVWECMMKDFQALSKLVIDFLRA